MKPLYELVTQYRALEQIDSDEIDEQTLLDTLEGLQGELTIKATNVAMYVRNIEAFAQTVEGAAQQMADRAKRIRKRADSVRQYLLVNMQASGISKIEAPQFTLALKKNPPSVHILEGVTLPDKYMVQPPTPPAPPARPDKKAIAQDLKAGVVIDGCRLESSERLEIKA